MRQWLDSGIMDKLLESLADEDVRFLLIGGQAMRLTGMPRFSMDWDLFIPPRDQANVDSINRILVDELDMPLRILGDRGENFIQTYQTSFGVIQFHLGVPGAPPFANAESERVMRQTETGVLVPCLCGEHLLATKEAADRPQDQADIDFLRELRKLSGS